MKLLFYCWGSLYETFTTQIFSRLNINSVSFCATPKDYHFDADFSQKFITALHSHKPDVVFSYNYFPIVSMLCEINKIPYISWIYDCPHYTLFSKTLLNSVNYIFCFDQIYTEQLAELGAKNILHFPLGADIHPNPSSFASDCPLYCCDISFAGSLYTDSRNQLLHLSLSEYTKGFLEGLANAQLSVYGLNFIQDCIPQTIQEELVTKCNLGLNDYFFENKSGMCADVIGFQITSLERIKVLSTLSSKFHVSLFSSSDLPNELKNPRLKAEGFIDFDTQLPFLFYNSKINLNMTPKTVQSGIPGRIFDIMGNGGFCLSAYQPELAEYFIDGEEIVLFSDYKELVAKADYYLTHEEERKAIAQKGYERLKQDFSFDKKFESMFDYVLQNYAPSI